VGLKEQGACKFYFW